MAQVEKIHTSHFEGILISLVIGTYGYIDFCLYIQGINVVMATYFVSLRLRNALKLPARTNEREIISLSRFWCDIVYQTQSWS